MGLHIKKNEQTGEIFVSNIGLFLKCLPHKSKNVRKINTLKRIFEKQLKVPGSDAEQSNVKANDIIVSINGIELKNESIHECANLMSNSKEYVDFKLKRVLQNKEST